MVRHTKVRGSAQTHAIVISFLKKDIHELSEIKLKFLIAEIGFAIC